MMGRPGLPVALLLLTLSGCAGIIGPDRASDGTASEEAVSDGKSDSPSTQESVPAPAPQRRPASEAAADMPADALMPQPEPDAAGADASSEASEAGEAEAAPAQKMPDFDRLMGLAFGAVEDLLGPADVKLDVPPARNWIYAAGHCRLVISFYPDLEALDYRVLSYRVEVEDQGAGYDDDAALEGCETIFRERLHIADS